MIARAARRYLWTMLGVVSLALGLIGILLPLLPTTPFLILAAYLFSLGSRGLEAWLINHRTFGPPIRNWRTDRSISKGAKICAVLAMALVFAMAVALEVPGWALAVEGAILSAVAVYLLTRPTPPRVS